MFRRFGLKPKCLNLSIFRQCYDQSTKKSRPFRRLILFTSGSTAIAGSVIFAGYYYSPEMRKIIDSFIKSQVTSEPEIEKPKIAEEMVEVKLGGSEPQQEKVENEPESVHLSSAEVMSALSDLTLRANKSLKHAFERFDDYYAYLVEFCYGKGDLANNKAIPGHAEIIECRNECRLILDELNRLLSTGYHKGCVSKLKEFVENRLASLEDLYDPRKLVDRFQLLLKEAELEYVEMDESPITQILLVRANRRLKALNQELSNQKAFKELVIEKEIQKRIRFMLDAERLILSEQISEELARESQILLDEQLDEQAARLSDQYASLMDEEQKRLSELYEHRIEEMREVEKLELRRELCVLSAKVDALENVLTRRIDLERRQQLVQGFWLNCSRICELLHSSNQRLALMDSVLKLKFNKDINKFGDKEFVNTLGDIIEDTIVNAPATGLETDSELRKRFKRVSRISRRLIGVDNENRKLSDYLIAYLVSRIPRFFRSNAETDDMSCLIDAAGEAMDRGDREGLVMAVKILNLLHGEPKRAFSDWIQDAVNFLTLDQCSRLLLAEASRQYLQVTPSGSE